MRFSRSTHLLMCVFRNFNIHHNNWFNCSEVELINLVNSVTIFLSPLWPYQMVNFPTWITVILTVLLFWIYFFLLMLVFVLQWLSVHWEILIMSVCFHWFSYKLKTRGPLSIAFFIHSFNIYSRNINLK